MKKRELTLAIALIPIVSLVVLLFVCVQILKTDVQIPIFLGGMVAALVGIVFLGMSWREIEEGIVDSIKTATGAIVILMVIGMLVGTWTQSGVVPVMVYYGLKLISPSVFLAVSLIICSIVSLCTGSSGAAAATVGIALMGVGAGLGIPNEIIAGSVLSGAYFGDKMSPLSDTTNLASCVVDTDIFEHIKHMIYTTLPGYIITFVVFIILGMKYSVSSLDLSLISQMNAGLEANYNLNPALFLIVIATLVAVMLKVPAILALFASSLVGVFASVFVQGRSLSDAVSALHYGNEMETGITAVNELVNRGGMDSMMWTISIVLCAMIFGGIMDRTGMLEELVKAILKLAHNTGSLIATTVSTCILMNVFGGDQYLSIVVPGKMFKNAYEERGLESKNLSRVIEDAGTLTSPLIPWNNCGAYMSATLGLMPWVYVPYCILNWITPIVSVIYGYTGFTIVKKKEMHPNSTTQLES